MSTRTDLSGDFFAGDRISLIFDDQPDGEVIATITRKLSDWEEGLAPEIEDYVNYWLEISCEGDTNRTTCDVLLLSTGRYWTDGRFVTLRKM